MARRTETPAEQKLSLNDFYVIFSGMRGVRRGALEAIYRAGYDTVEKVQKATVEELIKINGVGEKVAEKVISRAREYGGGRLEEILLAIPRLRKDVVQEIINRYPTEESLRGATVEELMEIRGVGRSLAQKILEAMEEGEAPEAAPPPEAAGLSFEEFSRFFRGIPGVTSQILKTLYENGINTIEKVAGSAVEDLARFRGIGEKTALRLINRAEDILKATEEVRPPALRDILLSIPRMKRDVVERILEKYPDLSSIKGATVEELMEIKGVGESLASKVVEAVQAYSAPTEGAPEVPPQVAPEEPEEKKEVVEEGKRKGPGAVSAIISNIKGIFSKIKGVIFPDKGKVKEKVEKSSQEAGEKSHEEGGGEKKASSLEEIEGLNEEIIRKLKESGYRDIEELKEATVEDLIMIEGIDEETARKILSSI